MIETLPLVKEKKEWFFIFFILITIFSINTTFQYLKFKEFKSEEIYQTKATIINIYPKSETNFLLRQQYEIFKLQSNNFVFFTSNKTDSKFNKLDTIDIMIVTKNITFVQYLKGFYTVSFNHKKIQKQKSNLDKLSSFITASHNDTNISELFNALFLAIPTNKAIKQICANYGISHLIAISGFHLAVLSFVLYWILYNIYTPIKRKYFPYRNTKFDILIMVSIILFSYLLFLGLVPSLLRSFLMFIFGIFFLRTNIKILSFQTLGLVVLLIIAFFPKLLFSLSLWFSVAGVFYIFLFLQYFKNLNKIVKFFLFNIWIYLAISPITHFFFGTTAIQQLYSPIFTLGFTIFYPVELFLHFISFGNLLDDYISLIFNVKIISKEIFTPLWIFISYIVVSLLSISCPKWFRTLNLSFLSFNLWLFAQLS
jgi:competence protein ComEC